METKNNHRPRFISSLGSNMLSMRNSCGHTLVELAVVIAVLGILAAFGIQSYAWYLETTRDAKRVDTLAIISKFLEEYVKVQGTYPLPDKYTAITWSGGTAWYQGTVSDKVALTLRLSFKPVDPIYANTEYAYSLTANQKQYQLGSVYESSIARVDNPLSTPTFAAGSFNAASMVRGTYNQLFVAVTNTGSSGTSYISAPSIILSDTSVSDMKSTSFNTGSFVIHKLNNIPASYSVSNSLKMSGSFYFTPAFLWYYSGTLDTAQNIHLMENLKSSYSGAPFLNNPANISLWNMVVTAASGSSAQRIIGESALAWLDGIYVGAIGDSSNSCATQPVYVNGTFTTGIPTMANQAWQNSDSALPCYYICNGNYKGTTCSDYDGVCGTANGQVLSSSSSITGSGACNPTYGSSLSGSVQWSGPWTWQCNGTGSSAVAITCSASKTTQAIYANIDGSVTPYMPDGTKGSQNFSFLTGSSNAIVVDNITGLQWQSQYPTANTTTYSWTGAKAYCAGLTTGWLAWRLPDKTELMSIIDYSKASSPVIDTTYFQSTAGTYWTSTTTSTTANAWYINFTAGDDNGLAKTSSVYVRCVH